MKRDLPIVMPGLVPGIHVLLSSSGQKRRGWPGRSPAMTAEMSCAKNEISPSPSSCFYLSSPCCKNNLLRVYPKSPASSAHPAPIMRGVSRSSRTLGRDAVDAGVPKDERRTDADGEVVWF
jgi:hypothetical protein